MGFRCCKTTHLFEFSLCIVLFLYRYYMQHILMKKRHSRVIFHDILIGWISTKKENILLNISRFHYGQNKLLAVWRTMSMFVDNLIKFFDWKWANWLCVMSLGSYNLIDNFTQLRIFLQLIDIYKHILFKEWNIKQWNFYLCMVSVSLFQFSSKIKFW